MRNRLVELLKNAHDEQKYLTSDKSIQAIADHLIANGVIVPPCKVGDKVYEIVHGEVSSCDVQDPFKELHDYVTKFRDDWQEERDRLYQLWKEEEDHDKRFRLTMVLGAERRCLEMLDDILHYLENGAIRYCDVDVNGVYAQLKAEEFVTDKYVGGKHLRDNTKMVEKGGAE